MAGGVEASEAVSLALGQIPPGDEPVPAALSANVCWCCGYRAVPELW